MNTLETPLPPEFNGGIVPLFPRVVYLTRYLGFDDESAWHLATRRAQEEWAKDNAP